MKKFIINKIKEQIEVKSYEWAQNYIASIYQSTLTTPEAIKQVESAKHNMGVIQSTITFLKSLLKKESAKK